MKRQEMLYELAKILCDQKRSHPLRVGINGADAAGKTYLADELAERIQEREVIRASIDGFHNPREVRYRKGRASPEGYYRDSFDNHAFIDSLLQPLGPSGNLLYKTATFDHKTDKYVNIPSKKAKPDDILIVDGIFLFRPELQQYWDIKVFLDVPFAVTTSRSVQRDGINKEQEEMNLQNQRYISGQKLYFQEAHPHEQAHIVIDNTDFANPEFFIQKQA